ncbi:outer membrane protein assembly factor BamA [Oxalobacter aliiformigenes]|uniref:Outer membrane protein assembly factor BamA n=2 Tax=Oxalobacter aliiformigenes TaxID=2946593 RepID=A0ABY7JL72_9BURK|nr:outer membrane protein assembly factor BamA [Oxalobacter aliiformigenes]WAV93018.1 outer membrane protein assembly factor BamA [Oxalobacter aliiformigenes]WAV95478.1 outer membrane protein assembly factor BamA [Oxalobacter aliiformigenes]WAV96724.1 outer membrane protein assembly factor BamA [Oxalobacter aliiformigenes]
MRFMKLFHRCLPFRLSVLAAASAILYSGHALAIEPFTVKDIRVEGIQRTEAGTVFNYLPVRVGDTFSDEKAASAIKALYATGFFKDVRIDAEGDILVVIVEERPAIASVDFTGAKEFDKEMLIKSLKDVGLGEARIYDRALVDRAEQELKRQYMSRGLYGVQITTTITPVERNRVAVNFTVDEGEVSRIKEIKFVGNKAFSDKELMDRIKLRTPGWFTWYTRADQYSKEKLTGDIEALKSFYQNNGYIEMQVESTQVSITSDKKDIYITLNINEGDKFTVSDIHLEGELFGREDEIKSLVELKKGDIYSGEKLTASSKKISDYLGNFGYAFANVNPQPDIDKEKKEVAFTIFIDPGKRVYVRQINIAGNTKTRDEVIRREFRQMEGSWYDGKNIKLSRDRVDRLGFFTEVSVETPEVPGTVDQVDVNMKVVEKPTGNLMLGAGFSQEDKLLLSGSIEQQNFAGTGNDVALTVNTSKRYRTIALTQNTPYFTDDGISRRYELFYRTIRPPLINDNDYKVETLGANVKFGVPFTEVDRVFFGGGVERTAMDVYWDSPERYKDFVRDFGDGDSASAYAIPLTVAWARDSRDSSLVPTKGRYQKANLEVSMLGDMKYYKASYQHQYFIPMFEGGTLALNGMFDYGKGLGGKPYPVFKNVYAGGMGTVRGYESSSLGQVEYDYDGDREYLGGTKRVVGNVELQFPMPGMGGDRTLRWFTFLDGGNVFTDEQDIDFGDLRYSAGFGVSWVSPIGPLKLSYGFPLNAKEGDRKEAFQFQLGTGF